jgi:hypothetical protein
VTLQPFASQGLRGLNAVGLLPGTTAEIVVIGAHHDTAPEAPGAYDDGGGVGVLIESARVLSRTRGRRRTLAFVSFDGEEAWATARTTLAGSREYVRSLGPRARDVACAFIVEMCGWKDGTPVLLPIPYADPLQPGQYVISPGWTVAAALRGARASAAPLAVGDPYLAWLFQPAVRTVRVVPYGDDQAFVQAGLPAALVSDSSFSAFYPWYHRPGDTADKLDAASLARVGRAVVGAVEELSVTPRGPAREPDWFAAAGRVAPRSWLLGVGVASLAVRLLRARRLSPAALLHAVLFGVLLWRHPVVALWVFLLPNLLSSGWRTLVVSLVPLASLVALSALAWARGFAGGLWLAPWELLLAALALVLSPVRTGGAPRAARRLRDIRARPPSLEPAPPRARA